MTRAIYILCLSGLLVGSGVGIAQELDPGWVVGKWQGVTGGATASSPGGRFEIDVKSDGTYEGDTKVQTGFVYYREGTWRITGDSITFEHVTDPPPGRGTGSKVTWTVRRNGENLEGIGVRHVDNARYSVKLTRVK